MNLRLKIVLCFVAAVAALGVFFQFVWAPQSARNSDRMVTYFTHSHIASVADGLVPLMLQNRPTNLHETLRTLQTNNPDWRAISLYDKTGSRVFPVGEHAPPKGETVRTFERPIRFHGEYLGHLSIAVDIASNLAYINSNNRRLAAALVAGFILIMIAIALLVDFAVRRPAQQLVRAANRLAQGDFEAPLPAPRHDEIGELIAGFRTMRDTIQSDRDHLERRVRERTAELQASHDALTESEARFSAVFDNSPAAISLKDRDGRIRLINRRYTEWFGVSMADALGKTSKEVYRYEEAGESMAHDRKVLETGEISVREIDGYASIDKRFVAITKFPVLDPEGRTIGVGSIIDDITEKRSVEAQLRQSQKMEAIGHLTGGIAHEFNNLLTVVLGNVDLLQKELSDNARLNKMAGTARAAVMRGAELTKQLLAYSRKQLLSPRAVDLEEIISSMAGLLRRTLGETIAIEVSSEDGLWPVKLDRGGFEDALLNLCLNARDAMPGGGTIRIAANNRTLGSPRHVSDSELASGEYVVLSVSDTGSGIAGDLLDKVFEPFFTTKDVGEGAGLGLSMVYGFVKQSGGAIAIESEHGDGATVTLWLPKFDGVVEELPKEGIPPKPRSGNGETILVVEDDHNVRNFVAEYLAALDYQVIESVDAASALSMIGRNDRIDLLFTDIVMPGGMDGPALFRRAQELQPDIKVVFATGYSDGVVTDGAAADRGGPVLRKPYDLAELAETLSAVID